MKKSFLKRVAAAAIAVPVALTQTALFTSFAAGETASTDAITVDTFLNITPSVKTADGFVENPSAGAYKAKELDNNNAFVQESTWNKKVATALTANEGTYNLDKSVLADAITREGTVYDILKNAINDEKSVATAVVARNTVTITISFDYNYANDLKAVIDDKVAAYKGDIEGDFEFQYNELTKLANAKGTITMVADAAKLAKDKTVDFSATVELDGESKESIGAIEAYADELVKNVLDAANADADATINLYSAEFDKAQEQLDDAKKQLADAEKKLAEKQADKDEAQKELDEIDPNAPKADVDAAQKKLDDAQEKLDQAKKDLADANAKVEDAQAQKDEAQKKFDTATNEIKSTLDGYADKYSNMKNRVDNVLDSNKTYNVSVNEAATVDDVIKATVDAMPAKVANKVENRFGQIPTSIADAQASKYYEKLERVFNKALEQINVQIGREVVDITLADVVDHVKDGKVNNITADATFNADGYTAEGEAIAYYDEETPDYTVYIEYFNEKLVAEGLEVDEDTIDSVEVIEAEGNADGTTFTGEGTLNIYRVVWFDTKPVEEETTEETEESTEESTDPTEESTEEDTTEEDTTAESTEEDTTEESTEPSTEEDTTEESTEPSTEEDTTEESTEPSTEADTTEAESTEPSTEADTTEPVSEEETTEPAELVLEVKTQTGFYFAHDPNSFDASELISSAAVVEGEGTVDMSKFSVESNPQAVYEAAGEAYVAADLQVYYDGQALEGVTAKAYIGVKGDADLNGVVNAEDAAKVLIYAAAKGAGKEAYLVDAVETDDTLEAFAYFLADTDGESTDNGATSGIAGATNASAVDSIDAANILVYAARLGSKGQADWINEVDEVTGVLSSPFPTYSESIAKTAELLG